MRRICLRLLVSFVCGVCPLFAIVTAGPPVNFVTPLGRGFDGVVSLFVDTSTFSFQCSGVLLGTGRYVLTAAHCVTDSLGHADVISAGALIETPSQVSFIQGAGVSVYPGYDGNLLHGNDLAILALASPAPPAADRYEVYAGTDEVGRVGLLAGYGLTGKGRTDLSVTPGERRAGLNRLDADGSLVGFSGGQGLLLYDFDNGRAANDGFGLLFGIHDLGEAGREVLPSFGDSGGPTFLSGSVAGIHSFVFRLKSANGLTSDVDTRFNQSFGEFGADTRLSMYADWIHAQTSSVPEPSCWAPVMLALVALLVRRHRTRAVCRASRLT